MEPPFVSFVLPVLNAESVLPSCLKSIRNQDYPVDRYEVLLADGGSIDRTRDIAAQYGCVILDAKGMLAEAAKQMAFGRAAGKYIAMIDSDNEIAEKTWLSRAISALENNPDAIGFESYYLRHPQHTVLNAYLTALLQISEPCAKAMASRLNLVRRNDDGLEVFELPADGSYPTGANGFVFRKNLLNNLPDGVSYHEAAFFPLLMRQGVRKLVKIQGCGVYHHYVRGWRDFYRKRQRAAVIYLMRKEQIRTTWDSGTSVFRRLTVLIYHASLVGPAIEGAWRALTTGNVEWLLHPVASFVSIAGNAVGVLKYWKLAGAREKTLIAMKLHSHSG